MNLLAILRLAKHPPDKMPAFIREVEDIQGIRVIRLQGTVGKEIGKQVDAANEAAASEGLFTRSVLFDFWGNIRMRRRDSRVHGTSA